MAIIKVMTEWDFVTCERLQANFTIDGLREMFRYYDELYPENIEWDPVAFCCEWREESPDYIKSDYDIPENNDVMEYLDYHTTAIQLQNGNILYILF